MDTILLARIQFAANITFHILFPSINIALAWFLLFFKLRYTCTKNYYWMHAYEFWVKIFALCFALGIVSGITMSFQFGTNWPHFMQSVGNIAGPLLGYEVLTAFFLEATFLGIMLFGINKVSVRVHNIAILLVAIGTTLSAFWILALNSWMQTPAGFKIIDGHVYATSWSDIIFNPSMPLRVAHTLIASGITTSFFIMGISAYRWLRGSKDQSVTIALKTATYLSAILLPIQFIIGDIHGLATLKHQPAKIAAIEGIWETEHGATMLLFALPDQNQRTNYFSFGIPHLASLILTHSWDGEIKGLNEFPEDIPCVAMVFYAFRIMVGMGLIMLLVSWIAAWQIWHLNSIKTWLAHLLVYMTFAGWVATVAGWYVTETGRQPWLVYKVLKTAQAAAQNVSTYMISITLTMYLILYILLITAFLSVLFYIARNADNKKQGSYVHSSK